MLRFALSPATSAALEVAAAVEGARAFTAT